MTTEKRFKLSKWCGMASHSCILDGDSGLMLQGEVVGLLNTLHEENQELKSKVERMVDVFKFEKKVKYQCSAELKKLRKENEQLRQRIRDMTMNGCGYDE